MALTPASGALSQTQLQVLEQIRAMRAAKPAAPASPTAPVQTTVSIPPKPPTVEPLAAAATNPVPANPPRGSILNITV